MTTNAWLLISQSGIWFIDLYWWYDLEIWWWLRSTTGSYGRPVLEAVYGEIPISLHRGCLGDVSSGRVVGMSTWCITHGRHIQINTSVGTVYVFFIFNTKIYTYYVLKSICIIKGHWWSLTLFWPDDDQGMILTAHNVFLKRNEKIHRFIIIVSLRIEIDLYTCFIHTTCMTTCYYMLSLSFFLHVLFMVIPIHHWAHGLLTLLLYSFYRLVIILLNRTTVVKIFSLSTFFG